MNTIHGITASVVLCATIAWVVPDAMAQETATSEEESTEHVYEEQDERTGKRHRFRARTRLGPEFSKRRVERYVLRDGDEDGKDVIVWHDDDVDWKADDFMVHFDMDGVHHGPRFVAHALRSIHDDSLMVAWKRGGMGGRGLWDREVLEMEWESRQLARKIRQADPSDQEEFEEELRQKLHEIFNRKMELRQERIERLEEQIERQRSEFDERTRERSAIVERRLNQLLGRDDGLGW